MKVIRQNLPALIAIMFSFYAAYLFAFYLMQRRIVFPRNKIKIPVGVIETYPEMEIIKVNTKYGNTEAWLFPPLGEKRENQKSPLMIIAHGNATIIDYWPKRLPALRELGFNVLLVEYPGYGRSSGKASEESVAEALKNAYDLVIDRPEIDSEKVIMMGRSLGGGAICTLAAQRESAGLVLLSTFTSVAEVAKKYFTPTFLIRDKFDNLKVVHSYQKPVLVIHGHKDTMVPLYHGARLHSASKHGQMITYDCNHLDCPLDWNQFWDDITPFLIKCGIFDEE